MATHIILDRTGDTRHAFDANNPVDLAEAEKRFKIQRALGKLAFEPGVNGRDGRLLRAFDPSVEATIFTPARAGG